MSHDNYVRVIRLEHLLQIILGMILINVFIDISSAGVNQQNLCSFEGNAKLLGKSCEISSILERDLRARIFDCLHPGGLFLRRVFREGADLQVQRDTFVRITHQGGDTPKADSVDHLVGPRGKIYKVSQTEDHLWVPRIEVFEDGVESRQISMNVADDGNSIHSYRR